ncbi:MAG: cytochrome P460 family protein [bacterium]
MLDFLAQTLGWLHPPSAHFPIVCSILAPLAYLAGHYTKRDWLFKSAAALWILTLLTVIPTLILGHLFAYHLGLTHSWALLPPASALKGHLRFHALLGTLGFLASMGTFWGAIRLAQGKPWPFWGLLILGVATAGLLGAAGHEGGEMVFGSDHDAPASVSTPKASPTHPSVSTLRSSLPADNPLRRAKRDWSGLVEINTRPWISKTHGGRWVNTYVSKNAVQAYRNSETLPMGALVVKKSFENDHGKPSTTAGPIYVMEKGPLADSPETGGWRFAMQWDVPVAGNPEKITGPVTWLPGNAALNSCAKCHGHFHSVDYMGGVPDESMK